MNNHTHSVMILVSVLWAIVVALMLADTQSENFAPPRVYGPWPECNSGVSEHR